MDTTWFVPLAYAFSVAVKVLLPEHPQNRFIKLIEAECDLFQRMVPCPTVQVPPIIFDPHRIRAAEEMRMQPSALPAAPAPPPAPAAPVEFYG